jgi:SAM-dependent methyltransferase
MTIDAQIAKFSSLLLAEPSGYTYDRLTFRMRQLLRDLPVRGKRILEVGAGTGSMSIWLALNGAAHVMALEPEAAGASHGMAVEFERRIADLGLTNLAFLPTRIDEAPVSPGAFDVVLSYNSVNHLYETRADLNRAPRDRECFVNIFRDLRQLLAPGGVAIIADCSRRNVFGEVGVTHPIAGQRSIEWALHQTPQTWVGVMGEAGFKRFDLHWYVPYALRHVSVLADNALFAWLTLSHFTVRAFPE